MNQIIEKTKDQASADLPWNYGRVTAEALYLRKSPSRKAARWNNVWPKDRIALIKPSFEKGWYETLYRGQRAFAMADYGNRIPLQRRRLTNSKDCYGDHCFWNNDKNYRLHPAWKEHCSPDPGQ